MLQEKDSLKIIFDEIDKQIFEAELYVEDITSSFQEVIKAIHTKRAAIALLETQKKNIVEFKNKGLMEPSDYDILRLQLDRKLIEIDSKDA